MNDIVLKKKMKQKRHSVQIRFVNLGLVFVILEPKYMHSLEHHLYLMCHHNYVSNERKLYQEPTSLVQRKQQQQL